MLRAIFYICSRHIYCIKKMSTINYIPDITNVFTNKNEIHISNRTMHEFCNQTVFINKKSICYVQIKHIKKRTQFSNVFSLVQLQIILLRSIRTMPYIIYNMDTYLRMSSKKLVPIKKVITNRKI